jgi:outer membrane protein OmpA-like peptidoglycan-associated protein
MTRFASTAKFAIPLLTLFLASCVGGPRSVAELPPAPSERPALQKPVAPVRPAAPAVPAGPLTVARIGFYMDGLETTLRQHVHGDGILIARMGDDITVVLRNDILFARDGTMNADDVLEPLGAVLGTYVHTSVAVGGYTDTVGTPDRNLAISTKRAKLIADGLAHEGVAVQRITSQGFGETHLRVATGDEKKEPRNRRIEILLKAKPG